MYVVSWDFFAKSFHRVAINYSLHGFVYSRCREAESKYMNKGHSEGADLHRTLLGERETV